jgi:hypothetical protein
MKSRAEGLAQICRALRGSGVAKAVPCPLSDNKQNHPKAREQEHNVTGFTRRLRIIGLAGVLAAGLSMGVTAATAAPAIAANGPCFDTTSAQPTPLHFSPSASSPTVKFLPDGYLVTGNCAYWDNPTENRWYMQVNYTGPNNNGGYGYIWVQRLNFGSLHLCDLNSDFNLFPIGSSACPLYTY